MFNDDTDLLKRVITGDKLWVYGYDDVDISFGLCQAIFTDLLCIERTAAKIVLKLSTGVVKNVQR